MNLDQEELPEDLSRHTAQGGVWAIITQATRILGQILMTALLARLLTPHDFGLVAMAGVLMAFVGIFTELGLGMAVVQQKEIDHSLVNTLFYVNMGISLVIMLIAIAAAPLVAWFFGDPRIAGVAIAMALAIPLGAAGLQHNALLTRAMRWAPLQWTPLFAQLIGGLTAVLLAWKFGAGYWALVAQFLITVGVGTLSMWLFCAWRPSLHIDWRGARSALHFGLHLTSHNVLNYFHYMAANMLIGRRWGAGELGYFTRAYQLMILPWTLVQGPVGSAMLPMLSRLQDKPESWRRAFLVAFSAITFISSWIAALMIATANPLVDLLFGPGWAPTAHIFTMLSLSIFAVIPMKALEWVYLSLGRTKRLFRMSLVTTIFVVAGFFASIRFGAAGIAGAYSTVMLAMLVPAVLVGTWRSPVQARTIFTILLVTVGPALAAAGASRFLLEDHLGGTGIYRLILDSAVVSAIYLSLATPLTFYVLRDLSPRDAIASLTTLFRKAG